MTKSFNLLCTRLVKLKSCSLKAFLYFYLSYARYEILSISLRFYMKIYRLPLITYKLRSLLEGILNERFHAAVIYQMLQKHLAYLSPKLLPQQILLILLRSVRHF